MASKSNKSKSASSKSKLRVEALIHEESTRKNIPTAEFQSIMQSEDKTPIQVAYERRNKDLDPQLVWRDKDQQDWTDLVVSAPPLYIQEKVHPKAIIDDLMKKKSKGEGAEQIDLFSDFNGLPSEDAKTEFYQHDAHWSNRMILGDALQVMASLAEREGMKSKVQCIYIDPPYGIKFNSNFQWSTTSLDVKDGKVEHITREPEQVKAFRDTWRDGIHSYLTYLRDRLTVARDLLTTSGSIFVQIGDENAHLVRSLLDEVFGSKNFVSQIAFRKTGATASDLLHSNNDFILWYSRDITQVKYRPLFVNKEIGGDGATEYKSLLLNDGSERQLTKDELNDPSLIPKDARLFTLTSVVSDGAASVDQTLKLFGKEYKPGTKEHWKTTVDGMYRLYKANRLSPATSKRMYRRFFDDYPVFLMNNTWQDVRGALGKTYVVQTAEIVVQRCILMTTDPGDLVLDPTCGSGTTAFVAEQWGRRWMTIDTSRVALALARARIMGARFPYYLLVDSLEGQLKVSEISKKPKSSHAVFGSIRHGFVYERVPHIMLSSISGNLEIDVIWDKWSGELNSIRTKLSKEIKRDLEEWEVPKKPDLNWNSNATSLCEEWNKLAAARSREIEASIAAKTEYESLFDKPYIDKSRVRVAGPFTIESVSPHRSITFDEDNLIVEEHSKVPDEMARAKDFVSTILENLKTSGVQQAHKVDKITFTTIQPWPGKMICAEGRYEEKSGKEKRAAILVGPEFGTVTRVDLVEAAKEAAESDFEVLIACAFNFDARATEFSSLGKIPVLKARMNADLHMAEDLKNTGNGNLFVVFGEPDIEIKQVKDQYKVKINGVDVFHPNTGEVRSDGADGIACWMIDTDYNEESFFVRHAYFLGANDPYKALKSSLKAEIEETAWESLHSDTSRPFNKPESGRIAVKVINHLGDEVMKVFKI